MALKRLKRLPKEAAQPQFVQRAAGATQLGTVDADVVDVESRAFFSAAELERKVGAALKRRMEAGISDDVEDMQPLRAPAFDTLANRRIEVLWKYFDKSNGSKEQLIWASGRVTCVADGKKMKRSKKKLERARGHVGRWHRGAYGRGALDGICEQLLAGGAAADGPRRASEAPVGSNLSRARGRGSSHPTTRRPASLRPVVGCEGRSDCNAAAGCCVGTGGLQRATGTTGRRRLE